MERKSETGEEKRKGRGERDREERGVREGVYVCVCVNASVCICIWVYTLLSILPVNLVPKATSSMEVIPLRKSGFSNWARIS